MVPWPIHQEYRWDWKSDPDGLACSSQAGREARQACRQASLRVAERLIDILEEQQKAEKLAAFRASQVPISAERQATLPAVAAWVAWRWSQGGTQAAAGQPFGLGAVRVNQLIRQFIETWLPEVLGPDRWGRGQYWGYPEIIGDRRELLRRHFAGKPRPSGMATAIRRTAWEASRRNLGRPIDMGGPRDLWIELDCPEP